MVFAWGLAEAVFFFVVADVPITLITARSGFRIGLNLSLWATVGALLGGALVYVRAGADPVAVERMLDWVPAVSVDHIDAAKREVAENWIAATLIGGFSGDPYKLYAAAAGEQRLSLLSFLAVSFVARLSRFVASAALAQAITAMLNRIGLGRWAVSLITLFWIAFYAWYWTRMPW
jgi:membrane protein YqaA with SNARE-associated domain